MEVPEIKPLPPFLDGEVIYLRHLVDSDAESDYPDWFNDEEVCRGNSHHVFPNTKEKAIDYIRRVSNSSEYLVLAIVLKEGDKHIGNVSLQNIHAINRSAEISIIIGDKSCWGKGIAQEALKLLMQHGFKSMNLNRIYLGTFANNQGMQKVAEKLGMNKIGCQRQAAFKDGGYVDVIQYDVLSAEF